MREVEYIYRPGQGWVASGHSYSDESVEFKDCDGKRFRLRHGTPGPGQLGSWLNKGSSKWVTDGKANLERLAVYYSHMPNWRYPKYLHEYRQYYETNIPFIIEPL